MAARGPQHYRAGPHLPVASQAQLGRPDRAIADPAHGERVPRCLSCGLPLAGRDFHVFRDEVVIGHVPYDVTWPACLDCVLRTNPRPMADPLEVSR